jgi:hypothetical protein
VHTAIGPSRRESMACSLSCQGRGGSVKRLDGNREDTQM